MRNQTIFITGTDTDAGKSYVSVAILQGMAAIGMRAFGFKPVAAGVDANGVNTDALQLKQASALQLPYSLVNPILFDEPCAPHLVGLVDENILANWLGEIALLPSDLTVIEGAGGWLLPIGPQRYLADWVQDQGWPVVLVVGMKLGCLNHAMLTFRELQRSGVEVIGWVANQLDPSMLRFADNLADLQQRLTVPFLGLLPYQTAGANSEQAIALANNLAHALERR